MNLSFMLLEYISFINEFFLQIIYKRINISDIFISRIYIGKVYLEQATCMISY